MTLFAQLEDSGLDVIGPMILIGLCLLLVLAIVVGLGMAVHYFLTLPLRRAERARFFLDLVDAALSQGLRVENMIVSVAQRREKAMGVRFHQLAAHLENGLRLQEGLQKVPRLLPPQIVAMLRVGEEIGDLRKVLPACRQLLKDANSKLRGALNYVALVALVFAPAVPFVLFMLSRAVVPKFRELCAGMGLTEFPPLSAWVFDHIDLLSAIPLFLSLFLVGLTVVYLGGPRFTGWIRWLSGDWIDHVALALPWRKKRLQRDFSTMLALLLDAEVPEAKAVQLAAQSTANIALIERSEQLQTELRAGVALPVALARMDDSGELQWRLTNALRQDSHFFLALRGWLELLDARAFRQEQTAAHLITTGFTVFNGLVIGLVTIGMFQILIELIYQGLLW